MKSLKILFLLVIMTALITGCGDKKEVKNPQDGKDNTTKNQTNTQQTEVKLFDVISSVESSTQKGTIPNFTWMNGETKTSMHDSKGKVIFINFWATWCGPCKKEIPDLMQISKELNPEQFQIIGICISDKEENLKNYLKANPISYKILYGKDDIAKAFGDASGQTISAIPTSFIVDKNLKIVETIVGSRSKSDFLTLIKKHL